MRDGLCSWRFDKRKMDEAKPTFRSDIMRKIADLHAQIDSLRRVEKFDPKNQAKQEELQQKIIDLWKKL